MKYGERIVFSPNTLSGGSFATAGKHAFTALHQKLEEDGVLGDLMRTGATVDICLSKATKRDIKG